MSHRNKIAVIADDFTGAAEIGGIGLRHGFRVVIEMEPIDNKEADLLIIATDTRSMHKEEAVQYITRLTRELMNFHPLIIYKKIDSVLRGNVSEELVAQMKVMQLERSVIIAANPVFNRIIRDGSYLIDGIPLDQTRFSDDLQYPMHSSHVLSILAKEEDYPLINLRPDDLLPEKGLIVGDVENMEDLNKWAAKYNDSTLFAGASGFFDSLLRVFPLQSRLSKTKTISFGKNALIILGSNYPKDDLLLSQIKKHGYQLSNMPFGIYSHKDYPSVLLDNWIEEVVSGLKKHHKVVVASMHSNSEEQGLSVRIKQVMAKLVKRVADRITLNEILIEGGSTTSEILKHMNIKKLIPFHELDTGVIRMKVDGVPGLCITTKPGSYLWPQNMWLTDVIEQLNNQAQTLGS
jgi:uncharacterized protein YgbK (DUF1537 family)